MPLPRPERDVPAIRTLDGLAPQFRTALCLLLAHVPDAMIAETLRTPERQSFLYGFGRDYDDGRGIVTHAPTNLTSWHGYGLAADVIHGTRGWDASEAWFRAMGAAAKRVGLFWGGDWRLLAASGVRAVWESVHAL